MVNDRLNESESENKTAHHASAGQILALVRSVGRSVGRSQIIMMMMVAAAVVMSWSEGGAVEITDNGNQHGGGSSSECRFDHRRFG